MTILQKKNNTVFILLTAMSIIIALYPVIAWIKLSNEHAEATQQQKQNLFLKAMPSFMGSLTTVSYLMLLFAALAVVGSSIWVRRSVKTEKIVAVIVLVISCLLTALCLFQLM